VTVKISLVWCDGNAGFTGIDLPLSEADTSETERDTGFKAKITFAEGVKRTKRWLEEIDDTI